MRCSVTPCLCLALLASACDDAPESAPRDAGVQGMDASANQDAGSRTDGGMDGATLGCRPFVMPAACLDAEGNVIAAADGPLPVDLACTGLYADVSKRELACGVIEYEPSYALWTDGAVKRRFVSLPAGTSIDATTPDDLRYPVGAQFWKEFNIQDGKGGTKLAETRLLRKVDGGWLYTSYVWNEDATRALQQNQGVIDLFDLNHDVPTRDQCNECHKGRSDFVLGWDLILLGEGATGVTRESLIANGQLTSQAGAVTSLSIPGNAVERAALGYMHVNCGVSCHNRELQSDAESSGFFARLSADTLGSVLDTEVITSGVNKVPDQNRGSIPEDPASGAFYDIRPGDPERSLALARMQIRTGSQKGQMPRIGTHVVDEAGVSAVKAFIEAMSVKSGYPEPAD
jgi:hypothetical protein